MSLLLTNRIFVFALFALMGISNAFNIFPMKIFMPIFLALGAAVFLFYGTPEKIYFLILISFTQFESVAYILAFFMVMQILVGHKTFVRSSSLIGFAIVFFVIVAVFSYVFNQSYELNLLSGPLFSLTFLSLMGLFLYLQASRITDGTAIRAVSLFIFICRVQILIVLMAIIRGGHLPKAGDWVIGTFASGSNYLGTLLFIGFLFSFSPLLIKLVDYHASFRMNVFCRLQWLNVIIFPVFIVLADIKLFLAMMIGSVFTVLTILFAILFRNLILSGKFKFRMSFLALSIILFVVGAFNIAKLAGIYGHLGGKSGGLATLNQLDNYIYDNRYNHRYQFYNNIFRYVLPERSYLIGTGPGTFGSRAANARAHDSLYKSKKNVVQKILPPFSGELVKKYHAPLYDEEFYRKIHWKSALLSIPFGGWGAIIAETGLLGSTAILILLLGLTFTGLTVLCRDSELVWQVTGFNVSVYSLFLIMYLVFEPAFERPSVIIPYYVFSAFLLNRYRQLNAMKVQKMAGVTDK